MFYCVLLVFYWCFIGVLLVFYWCLLVFYWCFIGVLLVFYRPKNTNKTFVKHWKHNVGHLNSTNTH